MASRNQTAIDPQVKLLLVLFGGLLAVLFVVGVASGLGSSFASFLISLGAPKASAQSVGGIVKGVILVMVIIVAFKVLEAYFR